MAALVRCEAACAQLNERCRDGSSFSSRVSLQLQAAALIRATLTEGVPQPGAGGPGALWRRMPSKELCQTCLRLLHRLTLLYAQAWQSVDAALARLRLGALRRRALPADRVRRRSVR